MKNRIESLIGGLKNCIENARLRGDAYDVGYMSAMVTEARALLADGVKGASDARDAEKYRALKDYARNVPDCGQLDRDIARAERIIASIEGKKK